MTSFGQQTTATCWKTRPEKYLCTETCSLLLLLEPFNHHTVAPELAFWRMKGHMEEKQGPPANGLPITIPLSEAILGYTVSS